MSVILSIIIPTYNSSKTLQGCLESIANQTFRNFEVLVIDGVSNDNTVVIAEKYRSKLPELNVVSEPDKGIYDAMNKGISLAQGEWLYFLGSDDTLFDENVLNNVFINESISDFDFLYGNAIWGKTNKIYDGAFCVNKLFNQNICHQAIFIKKTTLIALGQFNMRYLALADWEINCKVFLDNEIKKKYVNYIICVFCLDGMSGNAEDLFYIQKEALFYSQLHKINFLESLEFKIRNSRRNTIFSKIVYVLNIIVFYTWRMICTIKYRKVH